MATPEFETPGNVISDAERGVPWERQQKADPLGVVLKGFDAALNRYVAVEVLAPHLGCSGAARKRFSREAQAAAAVVHDNVMEIHGVADADGFPYPKAAVSFQSHAVC